MTTGNPTNKKSKYLRCNYRLYNLIVGLEWEVISGQAYIMLVDISWIDTVISTTG